MIPGPDDELDPESRRPGLVRRLAAGAWHVPAGFSFLLRRPSLWPFALLPMIVVAVAVAGGFVLGLFAARYAEATFVGQSAGRSVSGFLLTLMFWLWTPLAGMFLGLVVALLLASPILERLSRRVEATVRGRIVEKAGGLGWELAQTLRTSLYFLSAALGVLLLSFIPIAGPAVGVLWGAHALAFQQTDAPLARRGLDFAARRRWHRTWRPESLGFGLASLATLLVPPATVFLAPVLTIGGTLLVLQLTDDAEPLAAAAERPAPTALSLEL